MKWRIAAGLVLVVLWITAAWIFQNRSEQLYQRIIQQEGYTLFHVKEGIAVEFSLQPEWIPDQNGEEKLLNLVLEKKFDTEIVLEKVAKRETDFYMQLNLVQHPNRTSGQLLLTSIMSDASVVSASSHMGWQVHDAAGNDVLGESYSTGEGPGNIAIVFIDDAKRGMFAQGGHVRYSGYHLYGYEQLPGVLASFLLSSLSIVLIVIGLIVLYSKRTESEKGLAWKLVGYVLLGGFTFSLNEIRLPLGFFGYWLFFRKPKPNAGMKHRAALLGLLLYFIQLLVSRLT